MRKILSGFLLLVLLLGMTGLSQAALNTIGAAQYNGAFYGMIYDDDFNLVWLDYTNPKNTWQNQINWASSLNTEGTLRYAWFPEYADFSWTGDWRLPDAHNQDGTGPDFGYNVTGSEMGHLFYDELGLSAGATTTAQLNESEFNNLIASWYWSGTEYADSPGYAWYFRLSNGFQGYNFKINLGYGLAVRSGQVSAVPVPGAILLLGSGLLGLVGLRRKQN